METCCQHGVTWTHVAHPPDEIMYTWGVEACITWRGHQSLRDAYKSWCAYGYMRQFSSRQFSYSASQSAHTVRRRADSTNDKSLACCCRPGPMPVSTSGQILTAQAPHALKAGPHMFKNRQCADAVPHGRWRVRQDESERSRQRRSYNLKKCLFMQAGFISHELARRWQHGDILLHCRGACSSGLALSSHCWGYTAQRAQIVSLGV